MDYKSPLSSMLLLNELATLGYLDKMVDGGYTLIYDLSQGECARMVSIPLVGTVTCGTPILAQGNMEAMIPVSTRLAKAG